MDRQQFAEQVYALRQEGKSIRAIARELGTYKTKIQRALKDQAENPRYGAPTRNIAAGAFVGRKRQMDELRAALEDVVAGWPRIVMLSGEPGIGKTRLAQEVGIIAADEGVQTYWGRCYEGLGAPSYWPWVQIIRDYIRERDAGELRSVMGTGAAEIAEIVSELKAKLPGLEAPAPLDSPDANRFRLFDSISSFFKNAAQSKPVMLVLEDLHWADRPSLMLLEFLAHEMSGSRILIVGTFRHTESQHALSQTIGELAREPYFQHIQLSRLELSDVGHYIEETSGARAPDEYTDAIYSRTEGNPFFMTEMVRLLGHDPSTTAQGEGFGVDVSMPDSVRGAIRRRLEGLSPTCNQALTIASVIGREFGLDLVSLLMSDVSVNQLLVELEGAAKLRIVDELDGEAGRYQFSHVLIQEALSDELSGPRKAALHAEIGEALEALYESAIEVHAAELAYHFAEAAPVTGIDKLVQYSLMAGESALTAYAWEDALAHFQRGLGAREGLAMDADKAALLFGLGRAQAATLERYRQHEAITTVMPAFEYYVAAGDVPRALSIAEYEFRSLDASGGMPQLLAEALKLVPPDSHQAGSLLSRYGRALIQGMGTFETVISAFSQSLAIAQRENDSELEMSVFAGMAIAHWIMRLNPRETLLNSLQAIELGRRTGQIELDENAQYWAAMALMSLGNLEGARPHADASLAIAEERGARLKIAEALHGKEVLANMRGDWKTARDFSDRGLALADRDPRLLSNRALLEYELGNFDQGAAHLERLVETMRLSPPGPSLHYTIVTLVIGVASHITGISARFDIAEAAANTALSSRSAISMFNQLARTGLALIALERGDAAAAREQYDALEPLQITITPLNHVCGHRVLGLLAQTLGNIDDAAAHFEDSLAFCRKAGALPEVAWTSYDYAGVLLRRDGPGDQANATLLLEESFSISDQFRMRPLAERVVALQNKTRSQPAGALAYPAGLTEREMEVLLLIAQGKTTREIAGELVLSPRTVQRHTTNLYAKINVRNRAEATAFALNELTPSIQTSSRS